MVKDQKPIFGSMKNFYEMTYLKHFAFVGLSYLVLRELPIQNFYARSVIWGLIGFRVYNNYHYDTWNNGWVSNFKMKAPEQYFNQWKIFEYAQRSMDEMPSQRQGGVSDFDKWKLMQPGFMENNLSTPILAKWLFKPNKEITWDGTLGMPVLPIADSKHKDGGIYYSF